MKKLVGKKIAVLATDGVEEAELVLPVDFLINEGAIVTVISDHAGSIQAFNHFEKGAKIPVDLTLDEAKPEHYDGLEIPGGAWSADKLRTDKRALKFVKAFDKANKPIAAICHAPWILISADLMHGRYLTSYHAIQDDIMNAGGHWENEAVITDDNWVTSRMPDDIPEFNESMLRLFAEHGEKKAA